jgi:hypothetical protein
MPFTVKDWQDAPSTSTPLSAAALEDMETRLSTYVDALGDLIAMSKPGVLAVSTGTARFRLPYAAGIVSVEATVGTAPTGTSLIVDVHKNGTTIFTTQSARPTIAASAFSSGAATPAVTTMAAGDYFTVDIDQIGATVAGSDLIVIIRLRRP